MSAIDSRAAGSLEAGGLFDLFDESDTDPQPTGSRDPAARSYVILLTPRSGSTFLGYELRNTGVLGNPNEWLNPDPGPGTPRDVVQSLGIRSAGTYIEYLRREHSSPNGVFGIRLAWPHLRSLASRVDPERCFGSCPVWFLLRRRNLIAQSVSLFLAASTGVFHSHQRPAEPLNGGNVAYDATQIMETAQRIVAQENALLRYLREIGATPIGLVYEDVAADVQAAVELVCNALGVRREGPRQANPVEPVTTELNHGFEERFRAENRTQVEALASLRPAIALSGQVA